MEDRDNFNLLDLIEYEAWLAEEEAKVRDPLPEDYKLPVVVPGYQYNMG